MPAPLPTTDVDFPHIDNGRKKSYIITDKTYKINKRNCIKSIE